MRARSSAVLFVFVGLVACADDAAGPGAASGTSATDAATTPPTDTGVTSATAPDSDVWVPDVVVDPDPDPGTVAWPEAILCPAAGDERCAPAYDPATALAPEALTAQYQAGLAAWRHRGVRGACAGCHSPDAIELARVGYRDDDILRRADDHVDADLAQAIVGLVHAQRQRYQMTRLLHPARYRPLQPALDVLHETTPGLEITDSRAQRERDQAFMDELVGRDLLWATGRIASLAEAHQAYEELLGLDLEDLPIGIPFDHLSEDEHFGEPHASVFEWFPGLASRPLPGSEADFYARVDAYLADPSDTTLWGYYDHIADLTGCDPDIGGPDVADYTRACDWMRLKWRSLQVLQHTLRVGTTRLPDPLADRATADALPRAPGGDDFVDYLDEVIARSPIWEAGDVLRVAPLERSDAKPCDDGAHPCTLLPPVVDETVRETPSRKEARITQSEVFQQSWFVMSWLRDPALLWESENFATFIGDYLESVLLPYYDIHHAFVVARMAVSKSAASAWFDAPGFRRGTGKIASVRTFSFKQLRDNFSPPPDGDPRRATHERMFANFARMWIHLVEEDLRVSGTIYGRDDVLYAIRFMRTWIGRLEGADDPAIDTLVVAIEGLAVAATELRTAADADEYPGLQPTDRWGEFAAPFAP